VVRLDGEGANWLYKPISFVPGVKVEGDPALVTLGGCALSMGVSKIKNNEQSSFLMVLWAMDLSSLVRSRVAGSKNLTW